MKYTINYSENSHLWKMEDIAAEHGYKKTSDCYWTQIFENESGDMIITIREDECNNPIAEMEAIFNPAKENAEEKPATMHKSVFTVGLFDKDTEHQEISVSDAKIRVSEILIEKFGVFAFTMIECSGVYRMASTDRIVFEPSIRVEIVTDEELTSADAIIQELKAALNQESIMHEISTADIYFK